MPSEFDAVANNYDQSFSNTLIGKAQRDIVWKYLDQHLPANSISILEINCGTGEDAIFLAGKGHSVLATDASSQMIQIVEQKISANHLSHTIENCIWDLNTPFPFPNKKFDLIFSDFGGLNCIPQEALKNLNETFAQLLNPNGKLIFVVMGRFCLMETIYFLLKGKFKSAFRRRTKKAVQAKLNEEITIPTWYYRPEEITMYFSPGFIFYKKKPVGIFIPPSYLENFFSKRKWLFHICSKADRIFSKIGLFAAVSDHYIIEMHKA